VAIGIIRYRRLDAVGSLVLFGIIVGTVAGLVTHSARLLLMEGSVPTAVFALACLGSLPMYRIALQARGAGTAAGSDLDARWAQPTVQRAFGIITFVWGVSLLAEAATRVLIVETISAGTALLIVKLMPYVVIAGLFRWMVGYARARPAGRAAGGGPVRGQRRPGSRARAAVGRPGTQSAGGADPEAVPIAGPGLAPPALCGHPAGQIQRFAQP